MWRDKRTGIWQTKVTGPQVSLRTKNSHIAGQREAKLRLDFGNATFGLRRPSRIIFKDLADQYLKALKDTRKNPKKFETKSSAIRRRLEMHIHPEFCNDAVMMLTAGRVRQWADRLLVQHAPDGVNKLVTVMRSIVKWGSRQDSLGIPFDPVNHWPRYKAPQDHWTTLTADEINAVLNSQDPELVKILPMVRVALHTGMRSSNVVLLKWSEVDIEHGFIRIRSSETKQKDVLTIPILPEVLKTLKSEYGKHPQFVFVKENGIPWVPNSVSRIWRKATSRIGLSRRVRFHDLRHTFASHLAMQGKPLTVVGEILGHKSPVMTKRYAHLTPEYLKQSLEGFGFCQPNVSGQKQCSENLENDEKNEQCL